ncbi:hypothetical protein [Raoultella terrigena]|uniref:hypothetical protein n=1 Tax=Raoultella terrigena TaxID=577 RepID=UPI003892653E
MKFLIILAALTSGFAHAGTTKTDYLLSPNYNTPDNVESILIMSSDARVSNCTIYDRPSNTLVNYGNGGPSDIANTLADLAAKVPPTVNVRHSLDVTCYMDANPWTSKNIPLEHFTGTISVQYPDMLTCELFLCDALITTTASGFTEHGYNLEFTLMAADTSIVETYTTGGGGDCPVETYTTYQPAIFVPIGCSVTAGGSPPNPTMSRITSTNYVVTFNVP